MAYERLNLNTGDVLTEEHIRHLENGIVELNNGSQELKSKLVKILADKDIYASENDSISDIAKQFSYLRNPIPPTLETDPNIIDISKDIESKTIKLVVLDNTTVQFRVKGTNGIYIDWGDGSTSESTTTSLYSASHSYTKGRGEYYDGVNTQFVVKIYPREDGELNQFMYTTTCNSIIYFCSKDVYFTAINQMFLNLTGLRYVKVIGGSLGTSDLNYSASEFCRNCPKLEWISGNVCWNSCTDMQYAFYDCQSLKLLDLGDSWDTRNVTRFYLTFCRCYKLEHIPTFSTFSSTSMDQAFVNCTSLKTIGEIGDIFDLQSCLSLYYAFNGCTSLTRIPELKNTGNVNTFCQCFLNCSSLVRLNQTELDTSNSINCTAMFKGCSSLEELPTMNFSNLVSNATEMFRGCTSLFITQNTFNFDKLDGGYSTTYSQVFGLDYIFTDCTSLVNAPVINAPLCQSMLYAFDGCSNLITVPDINFPSMKRISYLFRNCVRLRTAPPKMILPQVVYAEYLFYGCSALKIAPHSSENDVLQFPMAVNVSNMFYNCESLETAPYKIKLDKCTNASNMFYGCASLVTPPKELELPNITTLSGFFNGNSALRYPPKKIIAPVCTNMASLFANCINLEVCPEIDAPNVTELTSMFEKCYALTSTIPYYFPKAAGFYYMYRDCVNLRIIEEVKTDSSSMGQGFSAFAVNCPSVEIFTFPTCEKWIGANVPTATGSGHILSNATQLREIRGYIKGNNFISELFSNSKLIEGSVAFDGVNIPTSVANHPLITEIRHRNGLATMGNVDISNCGLNADAINQLFEDLPRVSTTRNINVKGNVGASDCNPSIATAKNWTVTTV